MHPALQRLAAVALATAALCAPAVDASAGVNAAPQEGARDKAPLPFRKPEAPAGDSSSLTVLLVLGLAVGGGALLALRSGAWRSLRVRRPAAQRAPIERLSTQMLAKGASLHAVRWRGEELLIGCTEREVTLLARRQAEVASQELE